jgi:hypothetical protein
LGFCLIVSAVESGPVFADPNGVSDDQARQECFKGKTIYCIALGLKEEKSGYNERALELYRIACKNHPTPGHLRACTPLLNLSGKMNRLEEEVEPLRARCRKGDKVTCFYLGKEYLKMARIEGADRYLGNLCKEGFRPPDPHDYGPCFHLAKGFEYTGQWNRARGLYRFDCDHHSENGKPSCTALKELEKMEQMHRDLAQKGIQKFEPVETVLFLVVLISCLHIWVWFKGGKGGLFYLAWGAPLLVWGGVITWVYWPDKPEFPISQWVVIYFSLLLVSGTAVFAFQALYPPKASP